MCSGEPDMDTFELIIQEYQSYYQEFGIETVRYNLRKLVISMRKLFL